MPFLSVGSLVVAAAAGVTAWIARGIRDADVRAIVDERVTSAMRRLESARDAHERPYPDGYLDAGAQPLEHGFSLPSIVAESYRDLWEKAVAFRWACQTLPPGLRTQAANAAEWLQWHEDWYEAREKAGEDLGDLVRRREPFCSPAVLDSLSRLRLAVPFEFDTGDEEDAADSGRSRSLADKADKAVKAQLEVVREAMRAEVRGIPPPPSDAADGVAEGE